MDNPNNKTQQETTIVLTVDLGGSQTKAIYQLYPDRRPIAIKLGSEIADISRNSAKLITLEGSPEGRAWVGIEDEYYVLGTLARHQFFGITQLHELKYQLAVPKICGLIWLVKEKLNLSSSFSIFINVLLPPGEMADKSDLNSRLKSDLKSFETPSGKMKVKLKSFNAATEGSGIYHYFKHRKNGIVPNCMFLMLGYRNASAFLVRDGVINKGLTSDLGMSWLVNNFISRTSGLNADDFRVVEGMVAAGFDCNPDILENLSRKHKPEEIKADGRRMSDALKMTRDEYWRAIARWLRSIDDPDLFEIVLCGGTADYIQPEIDAYCQEINFKATWHGGVNIPQDISLGLGNRMADVYALHQYSIVQLDRANNLKKDRYDNDFCKHPSKL